MKIIYPSKNFVENIWHAYDNRRDLEITLHRAWRRKMLAREIDKWPPAKKFALTSGGEWRFPSLPCGLLMNPLFMVYVLAWASDYYVMSKVNDDTIVITCTPLY